LKDFMTYASPDGVPITLDFGGAVLWSLAGRNGAGKSAIFDAITWCLFDEHRGGRRGHQRLIRSGAREAVVRFEFELRGHTYRITRTLRRHGARATQSWRADRLDSLPGAWKMVPNTDHENGFARFVTEELRVRYPTFIASTLLLQGRSDALIAAEPKSRFEILSGVLDLAYYAELSGRADERAHDDAALLKARESELSTAPAVGAGDLTRAMDGEIAASAVLGEAETQLDAARTAVLSVQQYADLAGRLGIAEGERTTAERLLGDATLIRSQFEEFSNLTAALPAVRAAARELDEADALETLVAADVLAERSLDLARLRESAADARTAVDAATRREREAHERLTDCDDRVRAAESTMADVLHYEALLAEIEQLLAEQTPITMELEREASMRSETHRLRCVRDALPLVEAIWDAEAELVRREAAAAKVGNAGEANQAAASARQTAQDLETALTALQLERERLRHSAAAAQAQLRSAEAALHNRQQAAGETVCSLCGQTIDAEHAATEIARAHAQVAETAAMSVDATERLSSSSAEVDACSERWSGALASLALAERTRTEAAATAERLDDARRGLERMHQRLSSAPEATREGARGLSAVTVQETRVAAARLPKLEDELARLQRARGRLDSLTDRSSKVQAEADQLDAAMPAAERGRRRAVLAAVTHEHAQLQANVAREKARQIEAAEWAAAAIRDAETAEEQALLYRQRITEGTAAAQTHRAAATARLSDQPTWYEQVTARRGLVTAEIESRLGDLAGASDRHDELKGSEGRVEAATAKARTLRDQLAEIPEAHRLSMRDAEAARVAAADARGDAALALDTARATLQHLQGNVDRRTQLELAVASAAANKHVSARLAELLDRKHLQAHLVEQALSSIEYLANITLGQVSRGELRLHLGLQPKAGEQEVAIDATDHTSADERLDVRFLSGGQKFRVAVAIAAAVGQFMGDGVPVGSLIIDEGFGGLDAEGRAEMIAALHTLAEHMKRVIVVSHHEEFQDRTTFPSGYLIEKIGHRTTARRFV
jgi:DNA repair exonuclease SbcCD ATPase subunit